MKPRSICRYNRTQIYQKIRQLLPVLPPIQKELHIGLVRGSQDSAWRQTGRRRDPHPEQWKTADSNHSHPGMGILDVQMDGIRLGWNSPVKEVVHPSHIDLESRGGLGWLEGFNVDGQVRAGICRTSRHRSVY